MSTVTIREYYAAHAPAEIPAWFNVIIPYTGPEYPLFHELPEQDQKAAADWVNDGTYDLTGSAELVEFQRQREAADKASDAHKAFVEKTRYFLWRAYYADSMLAFTEVDYATTEQGIVPRLITFTA